MLLLRIAFTLHYLLICGETGPDAIVVLSLESSLYSNHQTRAASPLHGSRTAENRAVGAALPLQLTSDSRVGTLSQIPAWPTGCSLKSEDTYPILNVLSESPDIDLYQDG